MKTKLIPFIAFFLLSHSLSSFSSTSDGKVIQYWIHHGDDNSFLFMVENQDDRPECVTFGYPSGRYAVSMLTEKGRTIASAIMSAKTSNARVRVTGKGICNQWYDAEDIWNILVYQPAPSGGTTSPIDSGCGGGGNILCK